MLHPWWPLPPGPAFSRPSVINTFLKVDQPPPWPCVAARWLVVGWRSSWTLRMSWSSVSSVPSRRSLLKGSNVGSWGRGVERGKYIRWKKPSNTVGFPYFIRVLGMWGINLLIYCWNLQNLEKNWDDIVGFGLCWYGAPCLVEFIGDILSWVQGDAPHLS